MPRGVHNPSNITTEVTRVGGVGSAVESTGTDRRGRKTKLTPQKARTLVGDKRVKRHANTVKAEHDSLVERTSNNMARAETISTSSNDDNFVKESLKKAAKGGVQRHTF